MGFRTPSVIVYQELLTVTPSLVTPFMDLVVVGPVYQCEEKVAIADYVLSEQDYSSAYPNKLLGANVDPSSVSITMSNIYRKVWPVDAPVLNAKVKLGTSKHITKLITAGALTFENSDITAGDYVRVSYMSTKGFRREYDIQIAKVESNTTIVLQRNIEDVKDNSEIVASVVRPIAGSYRLGSEYVVANEDAVVVKTCAQVATSESEMPAVVASATVEVSYRALRTDVANDFMTITSYSAAQAELGKVNINNPMSVAASLINAAVGDLTYRVLPIESDDNNGYLKALDILSSNEKVYIIQPLTTDKDVISAYASHCTAMSEPEKSKWRIMYANMPMPTTKVMVEYNDGSIVYDAEVNEYYLKDVANGMFVTNITRPTDFIDIYDENNAYDYSLQITEVLNDSVAAISAVKWVRTGEGYVESEEGRINFVKDVNVKYEVVRVLDTQGMAEAISEVAQSFRNKRLRYVQPDQIMLNVNSVDELVGGEYLCIALAAMRAGFPPHQGFSTMGISGIKRVLRSNKLFNEEQLAEMAGNGVFWVAQDEPEELPYVLYQTTTDTTQLETAEDSIVAVIDYASKYYKDNLKPVLGRYNVNSISVNYVKAVINSCSDDMVSTNYQYIGPILTSATLVSVETIADKIRPTIHIEVPYPVNGVDVVLTI